ncbi:MAG TPA: exodeoxyribonuclease VII small subunit [Candidatus Deferrimicrobium sp.]|nr:exodeoxyribonuclease VII small subunit [Candidatus Deferrimicrobium sp.]
MTGRKSYRDFESALKRLEEITERLESGESPLEESITLFSEGLQIAQFCQGKLSEAEQKIKIIRDKNGTLSEENLDTQDVEE